MWSDVDGDNARQSGCEPKREERGGVGVKWFLKNLKQRWLAWWAVEKVIIDIKLNGPLNERDKK